MTVPISTSAWARVFFLAHIPTDLAKAREALQLEAEKRRVESEAELTQMLLQTQLQIASSVSRQRVRSESELKKMVYLTH